MAAEYWIGISVAAWVPRLALGARQFGPKPPKEKR
jgi:hypothetical protein